MSDENTQIKDLTEMERLMIGSSINFAYNIFSSQIHHIESHDPALLELLSTNETAQEDYILLQNFRDTADKLCKIMSTTFLNLSDEEKESLTKPGMKLEFFFQDIFHAISCDNK